MRVATRDWCASRSVVSVNLEGGPPGHAQKPEKPRKKEGEHPKTLRV